ncbi:MAG: hypothetical protein A3J52_02780 [Omnitrophica bacterium RIFCSPHIGHO2_02_FULL_49_9]|nr:MAG: hypothetical protein A3J52_02780 [Omnitrophica bacterium RIFCSPHIGHO2_02_FULL_49_9]OGW89307.1 MAG: hypothetical protein A3A73_03595 [Omnitrophica bacterium RIFCSPLOWO2_01_FULL_50_24]
MKSLAKVGSFIFVFIGTLLLAKELSSFLFGWDPSFFSHSGAGHVVFYLVFIFYVVIFQMFVNRAPFSSLGLALYPKWSLTVLKGWCVGCAAFIGYTLLMDYFGVIELRMNRGVGRLILSCLIAVSAFGIAFTEEVLFRGFFLQTMLKDLPVWIAVTVTGVLFVLFHKLGSVQDFWTVPYDAMLAGGIFSLHLLLCAAYLKTKSLYLPIGIHSGLVFAKVVFRDSKLIGVIDPASYWFGLKGDARRGFLAWILFLSGIFILKFLISKHEKRAAVQSSQAEGSAG